MFRLRLLWLLALVTSASWATAAELPRDGMILHLDAARISASKIEPLATDASTPASPVSRWVDLSGSGNDFVQSNLEQQPQRHVVAGHPVVRFDGQDDHLRSTPPARNKKTTDALTLFVVAAPHDNLGDFRGLLAINAIGRRDYESGINIDLGPGPTRQLDFINLEGAGFGGAKNSLQNGFPFGTLHILECVIDPSKAAVQFAIDGAFQASRPREQVPISLDEWTLGGRFYTNGPGEQQVRGHFHGDIAEVVVWDRALNEIERKEVFAYLQAKHAELATALPGTLQLEEQGVPLVRVEDPPMIQMLMPGFTVRELPVELTNVNNVRYRHDGQLVTLGYNGDIHLLVDSDGDGLEDQANVFWKNSGSIRGPLGLLLTEKNDPRGSAAFVPSKGKVSMLVDRNGDDVADDEVVVADGWKEIPQNVDAVGIAMDTDGAIYFGLGTADYSNGYLIDDQGKAGYDLQSERGTVQRIAPDLKSRETVCTGVRFPVAFAFNSHGDLFCTDQEGATWLPNGNPLDELLHVLPGRHYGFPPRHPRHNPHVIDEPSVYDYGPQHQSTCGMFFNDAPQGQSIFGPESWRGDAIVCGESRGKLYRTKLTKTSQGYLATSQLIACLQMLTVDACLAPNGDMIVACHSGPPDWGTGPTGIGKLFRISWNSDEAPTVVSSWAEGEREVRIAFDRPIDPAWLRDAAEKVRIEFGSSVRAGDALENLSPPYAVVQRQALQARRGLKVHGMNVTSDLRTIILHTDPMHVDVHYSVTIPLNKEQVVTARGSQTRLDREQVTAGIEQMPRIDVDYALRGVSAKWTPHDPAEEKLVCWLPHSNLSVASQWTRESSKHAQFFDALRNGNGSLKIATTINVKDILRPAIQAGAEIDYEWPAEQVRLQIVGADQVKVESTRAELEKLPSIDGRPAYALTINSDAGTLLPLELELQVAAGRMPELELSVSTNEDPRLRPLAAHRFSPPWLDAVRDSDTDNESSMPPSPIAEVEGGSWGKGRRVFHSEAAGCFKCHAMQGEGAKIGPDLSNLQYRDYASVLRDIVHPSFAINPDYVGHIVVINDGRVLTGVLRTKDGATVIGNQQGEETILATGEIENMKPADVSIMPTGVMEKLSTEEQRDLMTYLLTSPPQMPLDSPLAAPPLRTGREVADMLRGSEPLPTPLKPLKIVLVAGTKDHGPGEHDYPAWLIQWGQLMSAAPGIELAAAWDFPNEEQCDTADVLIFFQKGTWDDVRQVKMDQYLARGGGAVYIHWAVNGDQRVADFSKRIGLASHGGNIRYRHGPLQLKIHSTEHPIVRNFDSLDLYDESYWLLTGDPQHVTLLGTSDEDGEPRPQLWAYEQGAGRVFVSIPGHYNWTFDDPLFRILLLRGIAWTAQEPVDRFNELVPLGARMSK